MGSPSAERERFFWETILGAGRQLEGARGGSSASVAHIILSPDTACHIPRPAAMNASPIQISALRQRRCGRDGRDAKAWECVAVSKWWEGTEGK